MTTLNNIKPGSDAYIVAIRKDGALRRRLLDMGLTPKTLVHVQKVAPFGDPMEIKLRGYMLTLRLGDASFIDVNEVVNG